MTHGGNRSHECSISELSSSKASQQNGSWKTPFLLGLHLFGDPGDSHPLAMVRWFQPALKASQRVGHGQSFNPKGVYSAVLEDV